MIEIDRWGKDHWSTFAYIETRIVDHKGVPDVRHMRCDCDLHPQFESPYMTHAAAGKKYPTRLAGGVQVPDHDDWCCLDDAEEAGLLENVGTGLNRVYVLTPWGRKVANALREHKAAGKNFASFRLSDELKAAKP